MRILTNIEASINIKIIRRGSKALKKEIAWVYYFNFAKRMSKMSKTLTQKEDN